MEYSIGVEMQRANSPHKSYLMHKKLTHFDISSTL